MGLPKIQSPILQFKLPVLNKIVKYRPFTVKEEKILLMAAESTDSVDMYNAFLQVINNCILSEDVKPEELHIFDLEIIFLLLRIASVGEDVSFKIKDEETDTWAEVEVNLQTVVNDCVKNVTIPSKQIQINDTLGIVLKDITLGIFAGSSIDQNVTAEDAFNMLKLVIDTVYDKEDVYLLADFGDEEITEFLESFATSDLEKIYDYLNNIPRVHATINYKVNKEDRTLELKGVTDFFQYV